MQRKQIFRWSKSLLMDWGDFKSDEMLVVMLRTNVLQVYIWFSENQTNRFELKVQEKFQEMAYLPVLYEFA